jgi:hypothetical protein
MSTNSSALFPARKGLGAPENLCPEFCHSSYAPAARGKVMLKNQPGNSLSLSVRPLNISSDLPVIHSWICRQISACTSDALSPGELEEAYSSILASDFAQPFIALIDDIPVCQLEVYMTKLDAISLCYESRPGDYGIHMLYDTLTDPRNMTTLLRACTAYFFSFPEVGRIITDVETDNKWMNKLIRNLGFRWRKKIRQPYKVSNMYVATRKTFSAVIH